ncbi:MAG: hypothetical protein ACOH2D_11790 [Gelidibacter sp.]
MGVKERLKKYCKSNKMSIVDFEASISASNGYINSISKSVGLDKLKSIIEKYPNLNLKWLFTGEGEMEISMNGKPTDNYVIEVQKKLIEKLEAEIDQLKKDNKPESYGLHAAEPDPKLRRKRHWHEDQ